MLAQRGEPPERWRSSPGQPLLRLPQSATRQQTGRLAAPDLKIVGANPIILTAAIATACALVLLHGRFDRLLTGTAVCLKTTYQTYLEATLSGCAQCISSFGVRGWVQFLELHSAHLLRGLTVGTAQRRDAWLAELVRRRRIDELKAMPGTLDLDLDPQRLERLRAQK